MLRGFGGFDDDPFFADFREHHRQMNSAFNSFGFGSMFQHDPFMSITDGRPQERRPTHGASMGAMSPFGMFDNMFANMDNMMSSVNQNFGQMGSNPDTHSYSHSSVMTYSNTGDGAPKVYQASSSTRTAPGGIKETKRSVRDSRTGTEKMSIGHHIGDRGHVMEKSRNRYTREESEEQEFLNIDETEAPAFNNEWREKTQRYHAGRSIDRHHRHDRYDQPRHRYAAITDGPTNLHAGRDRSPPREHAHHRSNVRRPTGPSKRGRIYED